MLAIIMGVPLAILGWITLRAVIESAPARFTWTFESALKWTVTWIFFAAGIYLILIGIAFILTLFTGDAP